MSVLQLNDRRVGRSVVNIVSLFTVRFLPAVFVYFVLTLALSRF